MNLWICFDWICAHQVVLMPGGPSEDLAGSSSSWFFTTFPFSNISQQGFQTQSLLGHFAENFLFSHFFQPLLVWPALVTLGVIRGVTPGPSSSPHHIKVLQKQSQNSEKNLKSLWKKTRFLWILTYSNGCRHCIWNELLIINWQAKMTSAKNCILFHCLELRNATAIASTKGVNVVNPSPFVFTPSRPRAPPCKSALGWSRSWRSPGPHRFVALSNWRLPRAVQASWRVFAQPQNVYLDR